MIKQFMKLLVNCFVVMFFIFIFSSSAFSLTIYPSTFETEPEPKVQQTLTVSVYNDSKRKCEIVVYTMDYLIDKQGKK